MIDVNNWNKSEVRSKGQEISELKYKVVALPKYEQKNLKNAALNT